VSGFVGMNAIATKRLPRTVGKVKVERSLHVDEYGIELAG